jgi:DNA invertase Pin-like site-specific DNA recombinase
MTTAFVPSSSMALYARTSSPTQAGQAGLTAQIEQCSTYAKTCRCAIQPEHIYQDVTSGFTPLEQREQFARLLEAAQRQEFDFLLVSHHDRFSPEATLLQQALDQLRERGISVFTAILREPEEPAS